MEHAVSQTRATCYFSRIVANSILLILQVQKKKIWEGVQPHLKTNDQRQVVYKGTVMTTGAGPVIAPTLANANIS